MTRLDTTTTGLARRDFLKVSATTAAGMSLGFFWPTQGCLSPLGLEIGSHSRPFIPIDPGIDARRIERR